MKSYTRKCCVCNKIKNPDWFMQKCRRFAFDGNYNCRECCELWFCKFLRAEKNEDVAHGEEQDVIKEAKKHVKNEHYKNNNCWCLAYKWDFENE